MVSQDQALTGKEVSKKSPAFGVFSAGGTAIASLALSLRRFGLQRIVAVIYEPVSEAGRAGVEELETQTSQLLSFQSIGNRVFGTQTAFNMLPRFGTESRVVLQEKVLEIRAEISAVVGDPRRGREDFRESGTRTSVLWHDVQCLRGSREHCRSTEA